MFKISFAILVVMSLYDSSVHSKQHSFKNYRLLKIIPQNGEQIELISTWENNLDFDIWNRIKGVNETVDVLLSPKAFKSYDKSLKLNNFAYEVVVNDIQEFIDEEEKTTKNRVNENRASIVGTYAKFTEIINYINTVVAENPNLASSYSAGRTYENRDLRVLKLRTSTSSRVMWLDCGIHAREWISVSSCIWFIDSIIRDYKLGNTAVVSLLKQYEFHIMPLVNPDGYDYSWNTYRMWRKNRSPNAGSTCIGTDLNRNFNHFWATAGTNPNKCHDTYPGPNAESELEIKAVVNALKALSGKIDGLMSIHSYGQMWLLPWGYTKTYPSDYNNLLTVGNIGVDALKNVYGTRYTIGSCANLLYAAAGGTFDYAKGIAGIKHASTMELRPASSGTDSQYGFMLPENRAPSVGAETYAALIAWYKAIATN